MDTRRTAPTVAERFVLTPILWMAGMGGTALVSGFVGTLSSGGNLAPPVALIFAPLVAVAGLAVGLVLGLFVGGLRAAPRSNLGWLVFVCFLEACLVPLLCAV
ncbi:MAG: hypothetical protein H6828_00025 [Planctomycetes bacterium]|nr:hypothetical protein [Planctomycetota bacterium]